MRAMRAKRAMKPERAKRAMRAMKGDVAVAIGPAGGAELTAEVKDMTQKERMLANLPYKAWLDGLKEEREENSKRIYEYNNLPPEEWDRRPELLGKILGKMGKDVHIKTPFHCDYGYNIEVGDNFFSNYNLVVLDVGKVRIGDNVQMAPNVSIYTAGHPVHPDSRRSGYEYGIDVTIGNDVWIGGNVCILPGVTIGDNAVVGAGSVVTKDIPANVVAAGNPCRVIREITEADRDFYFRDRRFDVTDY
jgi:acetyltransferase-like isoleucine patch superfamily enzyme